jgi:hypothetical protein
MGYFMRQWIKKICCLKIEFAGNYGHKARKVFHKAHDEENLRTQKTLRQSWIG